MFDIGMQELIVIFIVALLVLGPKKLPELGKTLGRGLAELRKSMQDVKEKMDEEVKDLKDPLKIDTKLDIPKWDEKKSPYHHADDAQAKGGGDSAAGAEAPNTAAHAEGTAGSTGDKGPVKG